MDDARTYEVRTYGCQMNVHDSERLAGLLEDAGYVRAGDERAGRRGRLQHLRGARERRQPALRQPRPPARRSRRRSPGMQIAVGGCLAQKDRGEIVAPGAVGRRRVRHPQHRLAAGAARAGPACRRGPGRDPRVARGASRRRCRPAASRAYAAWVSISVGCNNTCTFCIVPSLRGKEKDRRPGDVLAEIEALVGEGVLEVTLLGQNVNSYGVEFGDRARVRASCCARAAQIDGLERVRFTSPHPRDFTDDVIEAMAETPNVMPQLHMPLQSGSDAVLQGDAPLVPARALPRHHRPGARRDARRRDHHRHHRRLPRRDRARTSSRPLDVVRQARFAERVHVPVLASGPARRPRRWTTRCPRRSCRSATSGWSRCRSEISWEENETQVGRAVEVLVAEGEGRKDGATHRMSGRARGQPAGALRARWPSAAPRRRGDHGGHLRRAAPPRRRRGAARGAPHPGRRCLAGAARRHGPGGPAPVLLGLPAVGAPAS